MKLAQFKHEKKRFKNLIFEENKREPLEEAGAGLSSRRSAEEARVQSWAALAEAEAETGAAAGALAKIGAAAAAVGSLEIEEEEEEDEEGEERSLLIQQEAETVVFFATEAIVKG